MENTKLKSDAVRLGWALFHWVVVSVFFAGSYLCISLWRVSGGQGFAIRAPIVWEKAERKIMPLPTEYGDIDSGSSDYEQSPKQKVVSRR